MMEQYRDQAREVGRDYRIREAPLSDKWIESYKAVRDRAYWSSWATQAARRAAEGGFADAQTIVEALVRAVRLVDICQEVGRRVSQQWVLGTVQSGYQLQAAMLTIDAHLPFDPEERGLLRNEFAAATSPTPVVPRQRLVPLIARGAQWLSSPDSVQVSAGQYAVVSCYCFDWAQHAIETYTNDALIGAGLDFDYLDDFTDEP
jgi:hypothetical protein